MQHSFIFFLKACGIPCHDLEGRSEGAQASCSSCSLLLSSRFLFHRSVPSLSLSLAVSRALLVRGCFLPLLLYPVFVIFLDHTILGLETYPAALFVSFSLFLLSLSSLSFFSLSFFSLFLLSLSSLSFFSLFLSRFPLSLSVLAFQAFSWLLCSGRLLFLSFFLCSSSEIYIEEYKAMKRADNNPNIQSKSKHS